MGESNGKGFKGEAVIFKGEIRMGGREKERESTVGGIIKHHCHC